MRPLTITDVRAIPGDSAFLIDDGQTAVLYDTGFGFTGYAIADNIRKILGPRPLDYILLTHSHYDHAAGSAYLRKRYPNVQVVAGSYAETIFRKASARKIMGDLDRKSALLQGVTEYENLFDELRADISVVEGDQISCGGMCFTVIDLPGHTKCSVGYYLAENRLLLTPETLGVYFGKGGFLPSYLVGYQMTLDSIRKAEHLDIETFLLPHYGLLSGEEARHYLSKGKAVAQQFAQLILEQLKTGASNEEIFDLITKGFYTDDVRPAYPYHAYRLNTSIMIDLIRRELLPEKAEISPIL